MSAIDALREIWSKFRPAEAADLPSGPVRATPPKPRAPAPESFITSTTMRVADLDAQLAKTKAEADDTVPAGSGGRASSGWRTAVPDHFVDETDAPAGTPAIVRRAPTTENLDLEVPAVSEPAAPDAVRSVPIQELHSAGERCTACGAGLVSGDIFCLTCGAMVLVTSEEAEKIARTQYCLECRQEVLPGEIFCVACGAVVS